MFTIGTSLLANKIASSKDKKIKRGKHTSVH